MTSSSATWLALAIAVLVGSAFGLGVYTFVYAEGYAYLGNDPASCANCHVMNQQYDSWQKSSHHAVATCNDCHTPHNFIAKYATKAINGFNHSLAFTTGNFHEPIRARPMNRRIAQEACLKCHDTFVHPLSRSRGDVRHEDELPSCTHCHDSVGHPR